MPEFFDDAIAYMGFGPTDTEALRAFRPRVEPHYGALVDHFYACIAAHPAAVAVITGGPAQVERLKVTLRDWLVSGLGGPHDQAFYDRRARVGRVHVRIGLPQHYMFTAINVMRVDLRLLVDEAYADDPGARSRVSIALDRWLDLELTIMLHTYREDSDDRLDRQARLAAIGQLAASIAHELRNPLGVMESSVYLLRRRTHEDAWFAKHLDRIKGQIDASGAIIAGLLEMARDRAPSPERVSARRLVLEALEGAQVPPHVEVVTRGIDEGEAPTVQADVSLIVRALINLIENACKAHAGSPGRVEIDVLPGEHGCVDFVVRDDGPGFDVEVLPRAFEPLVTTRATGVGLGLALVRRVAERHGGVAWARNRPAGGAEVFMRLPGGA
mgnify:CR=1 FL=1